MTRYRLLLLILLPLLLLLGGCAIFGVIANAVPKIVDAKYTGLKGQDVAIMVWADRATRNDWPSIQIDTAAAIRNRLITAQQADKPDALDKTTFSVTPQSIARFQIDHPESDALPIADIARMVGVPRLVYVEITNFQTRPDQSAMSELFRGELTANVKVIEYDKVTRGIKAGYEEVGIAAAFPRKAPAEGVLNLGDERARVGTITLFSQSLAWRFYKHEEERVPGE